MTIRLELCAYTFNEFPTPLTARAAAAAGFTHMTITPRQFARDGGRHGDLRAQIEDAGITVSVVEGLNSALPGTPEPAVRDGSFGDSHEAQYEDCAAIAHALGAPMINLVHVRGLPTPIEALADAFAHVCERARGDGFRLGLEFVPGTGVPDLATAADVIRMAGAPNGSIVLDTWHLARNGQGIDDLDPDILSLIGGLQLADRSPDQNLQPYVPMRGRKLPGDGALPLAEIVRRVRAAHPDMPIGLEILSDEMDGLGPDMGARAIQRSFDSLGVT